jgi:uncharacterized protein (DUF924 family)
MAAQPPHNPKPLSPEASEVLSFWFGDDPTAPYRSRASLWFGSDPAVDDDITRRFLPLFERAERGDLQVGWLAMGQWGVML